MNGKSRSGEVFSSPTAKQMRAMEAATQIFILEPGDLFLFNGQMPHTAVCLPGELNVTSYEGVQSLHPDHMAQFLSVVENFRGPWQRVGQEWKDELQQQLRSLQEELQSAGEDVAAVCKALSLLETGGVVEPAAKRPKKNTRADWNPVFEPKLSI
eukprot:s516_g12.t1